MSFVSFESPKKDFIFDAYPNSVNKSALFCMCKIYLKRGLSSSLTSISWNNFCNRQLCALKITNWSGEKCQKRQRAKYSWKIETPLRLSIFNLVSDISREAKLTNKAERESEAGRFVIVWIFYANYELFELKITNNSNDKWCPWGLTKMNEKIWAAWLCL